jgi:hypothetical protein
LTEAAPRFADDRAAAVAELVRSSFSEVLRDSLSAIAVHGSAVTGYIPQFSDFDFVLFLTQQISLDQAKLLRRKFDKSSIDPFVYLQVSRVVRLDEPRERHEGLVEGAYSLIVGGLPAGWEFHSDETLRGRGNEAIERARQEVERRTPDWAVATGERQYQLVRFFATVLKPSLRGRLVRLGEPVQEVWRLAFGDLATLWGKHDPSAAQRLASWLAMLPPDPEKIGDVGDAALDLLQEVIVE